MLSCTNIIKYEILKWVLHMKICTSENYQLYSSLVSYDCHANAGGVDIVYRY